MSEETTEPEGGSEPDGAEERPAPQDEAPRSGPSLSPKEREAFATFAPEPVFALAEEPEYPPPGSVPAPLPLAAAKTYPSPRVTDIAPNEGPVLGDTKLVLSGSGLFRLTIVRVGGLIAQTIGATEPSELRVLTPPADKPGDADITVENPFVPPLVLPKAFRYKPLPPPQIAVVAPDHVPTKGGEISISGEGFVKTTAVLLDGKPAPRVRFISSTALDVTTFPGDEGRMVDVVVRNPDGQSATARRAFVHDKRFDK